MSALVWEPRITPTRAELHVDFPSHNNHIVERRRLVEETAWPAARRIALLHEELGGVVPLAVNEDLVERFSLALLRSARFGYRSARREIRSLRSGQPARAAVVVPRDAGEYGEIALEGLEGIRRLLLLRSRQVALLVTEAISEAARTPDLTSAEREVLLLRAARRALHNNTLELVGETLNMGRTAGALSVDAPPEFALRSEQLDKRTCSTCSRLHGEIALVGSSEYFALLPPTGCLGGGRCRGLMVFGDGPLDLRLPEAA